MTEAALATAPARGERLHPLYLLTGLGKVVRGAWGVLAGGAYLAVQDKLGLALLLFAGFILLSIASLFIRWLTFEFRLEDDQLRVEQGVLSGDPQVVARGIIAVIYGLAAQASVDPQGRLPVTVEQAVDQIMRLAGSKA